MTDIEKGDIFLANLNYAIGCEQGGVRPVVIIQNDIGNAYSHTTIIASVTSFHHHKAYIPTHVGIKAREGLHYDSIILLEQIRTIDKQRFIKKLGTLNRNEIKKVEKHLLLSFGIYF